MTKLSFETLSFSEDGKNVKVTLLKLFSTEIPMGEVSQIGEFTILNPHTIEFSREEKASTKFSFLLNKHFDKLTNNLTKNPVTYIHRNSGIPLMGNVSFGIVYRNSSLIEIKPVTSCNLDCIYCSISEGLSSKKHDFVIEKDYLIEELQKLIEFVDEPVEIHIGVQGEPFLYADMENLIADLNHIEKVATISIDTNGTILTKEKINSLAKNKKLQINFSLDSLDDKNAKHIAGVKNYNLQHVKEIIKYASEKMDRAPIVAPVFMDGYNNEEMEKIVLWVKHLKRQPRLGIQNFLRYKTGRNPAKSLSWPNFYKMLEDLEQKHSIPLRLKKEDFDIHKSKELPKPFVAGDIIKATIKCPDRFTKSVIAVSKERNISVPNCEFRMDKKIEVEIVRDKHNIFVAKLR